MCIRDRYGAYPRARGALRLSKFRTSVRRRGAVGALNHSLRFVDSRAECPVPSIGRMKGYYSRMNLPEPIVPAVQALRLLQGQTALVTGANSGIGRAIAIALGRAGANVVVNYVTRPEDAEAVVEEIRGKGQRAMTAHGDVSDEAQVQAMFAAAVREFGTIDILVLSLIHISEPTRLLSI